MRVLETFERTVGEWLQPLPHLPASWRKWLGRNVWWIIVIDLALSVFALIGAVAVFVTGASILTGLAVSGYLPAQTASGAALLQAGSALTLSLVQVVILALSVRPLRQQERRGWELLFLLFIVSAISVVVSAILSFDLSSIFLSLISGAIGLAISAYLLFEIRDSFTTATTQHPPKERSEKE